MSDQIDVNQLSNAIQQKVDLPAQKNQSDIDFVVESQFPIAGNNYTWYRLYKSGWVEQGGIVTTTSTNPCQVSLLKEMADTNYMAWTSHIDTNGQQNNYRPVKERTTSGFSFWTWNVSGIPVNWQVSGMSA